MAISRAYSFDSGATMIPDSDVLNGAPIASTAEAHTGAYSLRLSNAAVRFPVSPAVATPAVSAWVNPDNGYSGSAAYTLYIRFIMNDASYIELRWNRVTHTYDLYIDDVLAMAGGVEITANDWYSLEVYILIDTSGTVQVKLNGFTSINYSGDTKINAGTTSCEWVHFDTVIGSDSRGYIDDVAIGSLGLLGDIRCEDLRPTGDAATQWTPSTGSDNYALVDETPASDTDYVSTAVTAQADEYTLADWTANGQTPQCVTAWVRAKMDSGAGDSIKIGYDSGGTDDTTQTPLSTVYQYYFHSNDENPADSAAWADADIDALKFRIESVVV